MSIINSLAQKSKMAVAGTAVAFAMITIGTVGMVNGTAKAASCDQVNIVHCGIDGSSVSSYISAFKSVFDKGSDNGHSDLKAVYAWAGLSESDVDDMSADNTKLGNVHRNGEVTVDGKVVATDAWVTARFTDGDGFTKIADGVWARKTTTSFAQDSAPVLVHYNADGLVDSAVMVDCGNAVKVTPVKPTPKPVLKCVGLTKAAVLNEKRTYTFVATGSATDTAISSYVIKYSDGTSTTNATTATTTTFKHTFAEDNKSYTARVYVNGTETSDSCVVTITTPKPDECKPGVPVNSPKCVETPVVTTTAKELPATGPEAVAGIFAGTSALGAVAHRVIRRRINR